MRSVADDLRRELRERLGRVSTDDRIELSLRLGEEDVRLLASVRAITETEARRIFSRARAFGRRSSVANNLER